MYFLQNSMILDHKWLHIKFHVFYKLSKAKIFCLKNNTYKGKNVIIILLLYSYPNRPHKPNS